MNKEEIKISMPLIDDIELQRIDNFYNDIVDEYTKAYVKEKEQVITQRLMKNLREENKKYKEVIDKVMNLIKKYGKYDGKKCTQGFQMWSADFNKILDILKEVE